MKKLQNGFMLMSLVLIITLASAANAQSQSAVVVGEIRVSEEAVTFVFMPETSVVASVKFLETECITDSTWIAACTQISRIDSCNAISFLRFDTHPALRILERDSGNATFGVMLTSGSDLLFYEDIDVTLTAGWSQVVSTNTSSVSKETNPTPENFHLSQNYPNPFNPITTIQYTLAEAGNVSVKVYDILGRQIAVLEEGAKFAGEHSVVWNAVNIPSGAYIYRIRTGEFETAKKMLLLK